MQHLDLTDDEAAALTQELHDIVENDRYPFSPRIRALGAILHKLRPEPARKPLPPLRVYAPPRAARRRREEVRHLVEFVLGDFAGHVRGSQSARPQNFVKHSLPFA